MKVGSTMQQNQLALLNTKADPLLAGGLSLFCLVVIMVFQGSLKQNDLWYFAWIMAFFINGPHFLISYFLFYRLAGRRIYQEKNFILSGITVPLILLLVWICAGIINSSLVMSGLLYSMFFLVGWHYVKQGFGILMVHSSIRKIYFSQSEQIFIRVCIYCLWMASFISLFGENSRSDQYWGMVYSIPAIPQIFVKISQFTAILGLILLVMFFIGRKRNKINDSPTGLIGFFVNYVWLLPTFKNPDFALLVPMFHSLQYLLFAGNAVINIEQEKNKNNATHNSIFKWWGPAFITAALGFHFIPLFLDRYIGAPSDFGNAQFYLIGFILFINIHHYFIDSVLWKRESGLIRNYLKPQK
jgi:hypothetical protein